MRRTALLKAHVRGRVWDPPLRWTPDIYYFLFILYYL